MRYSDAQWDSFFRKWMHNAENAKVQGNTKE